MINQLLLGSVIITCGAFFAYQTYLDKQLATSPTVVCSPDEMTPMSIDTTDGMSSSDARRNCQAQDQHVNRSHQNLDYFPNKLDFEWVEAHRGGS